MIRFSDEGCGIPVDKLKKLGVPFYTTKENGTGLGLMVSYNIVENHKGNIHVISKVGKGTTFTISLPLSVSSKCLQPALQ
ncbi:ATP-binding protein [Brevibacillus composti]|uniref:ATP-binding protein n=1 Tax=Brevibacillus composti TaxID=2796470 RepID=UPI00226B822F|nr:ATP-binding protein [Brevibacillus composti]